MRPKFNDCIRCKGNDPLRNCGRTFCPIVAKAESIFRIRRELAKESFSSSSPAPFVGRFFYPNIYVGVLGTPNVVENAWEYDAPRFWSAHDYSVRQVMGLRSSLINSRFRTNIKSANKLLSISQEIAMASKPVDLEIKLKQKPRFRLSFDESAAPYGPNAPIITADITSNPKVDSRVEKVVYDIDLKAHDALLYLHARGFDENFLSKLLSVGNVGLKFSRKLVPTRWSITATDDLVGKAIIDEIKNYNEHGYAAYFGSYLGNYYIILLFPEPWFYELFEMYMPKALYNPSQELNYATDFEPYEGRSSYADNTVGGYYAARLSLLEKLKELRKQASVLALRFVTNEYEVPLGVWVVREAVRKSLSSSPISFASKELMLDYTRKLVKKRFSYNIDTILNKSVLLRKLKGQVKLNSFFHKL